MVVNVVDKNLRSFLAAEDQAYMEQAAEQAHACLLYTSCWPITYPSAAVPLTRTNR